MNHQEEPDLLLDIDWEEPTVSLLPVHPMVSQDSPLAITPEMRACMALLMALTEVQRNLVLCWFCNACRRYVGPGDCCHCDNDD